MSNKRPVSVCVVLAAIGLFVSFGEAPAQTTMMEGSSAEYGDGGRIPDFVAIIKKFDSSGELFRIEGVCKSACTMFLGIRNSCIERGATLMFHAGHDIAENTTGPNTRASRAMLNRYNNALRRYLLDGHFMESDALHSLSGAALIDQFGYRECPPRQ